MAEEEGHFAFPDVAKAIADKLIRRHPHVFNGQKSSGDGLPVQWEAIKKAEREEKAAKLGRSNDTSLFQGIPAGLPALLRSAKLQRRAARIGFDWTSLEPLLEKVEEEWAELRAEIAAPETPEIQKRRFEEFGDLMFVLVNLGFHLGIDAEAALRAANTKFTRRMGAMEDEANARWQSSRRHEHRTVGAALAECEGRRTQPRK